MILYHGSTLEIPNPQIIKTDIGRDFGFAFYTTEIKEQAERWAIRRAKLQSRIKKSKVSAVVSVYEWNLSDELKEKIFTDASMDWLEMVVKCRSDLNFSHGFDVVRGKIANDNVGETVSYVIQGIMRKEDAIERLKFEKINSQTAFCTEKSLKDLQYIQSYEVE